MKLSEECQNIRYFDKDRNKPQIFADGIYFAWVMLDNQPTVEAIPIEWLKNELIPKAEKLGATEYANNIRFVLEDWEAWKRYHG